jgi:hypothetical protein
MWERVVVHVGRKGAEFQEGVEAVLCCPIIYVHYPKSESLDSYDD